MPNRGSFGHPSRLVVDLELQGLGEAAETLGHLAPEGDEPRAVRDGLAVELLVVVDVEDHGEAGPQGVPHHPLDHFLISASSPS